MPYVPTSAVVLVKSVSQVNILKNSTFVILKDSGMRARSTSGEKEKRVIEQLEQVEDVDDE